MKKNTSKQKDSIYEKKKEQSLTAVSFLTALTANLDHNLAFKIAVDAFTRYMTSYYEKILDSTEPESQDRFDRFRRSYEEYSQETPYCHIVESSPKVLRVKFTRCPFFEILSEIGLNEIAYAFCLSDHKFTEIVLPRVAFTRKNEIAKGDDYCDHTWGFNPI